MLCSKTFWYSGVSGASCPRPHGLVWSCDGCPPAVKPPLGSRTEPGGNQRVHAPFQSRYFAASAAQDAPVIITMAIAAAAAALVELRNRMIILPRGPLTGYFLTSRPRRPDA